MKQDQPVRTLPPDVYDALELSALAFGGIGRCDSWSGAPYLTRPVCVFGHAQFLEGEDNSAITKILIGANVDAMFGPGSNDDAVAAINSRNRRHPNTRVSFSDWCKELNVIRGGHTA